MATMSSETHPHPSPHPALAALAVAGGAAVGGVLRWQLGLALNPLLPAYAPGTLLANALGGLAVGLATGWLAARPGLSPLWRLAGITGLLGGFTTFSGFSLEVFALLQQGRPGAAAALAAAHLAAALTLTALGWRLAGGGARPAA
jgi:CrcB protein